MKLIIHCGLHRAASTSLERWLETMAPRLAEAGVLVAGRSDGPGATLASLSGVTMDVAGPDAVADAIAAELDELAATWRAVIVSDENVLGHLPRPGVPAFAHLHRLSHALERLSRRHDVETLLILRDHASWLASLYRIAQFRCSTMPVAEFAAEALTGPTPFAEVAAALGQSGPLTLAWLDDIAADEGRGLLAMLATRLGCSAAGWPPLERNNASPSPLLCTLRQDLARHGRFLVTLHNRDLSQGLARLWRNPAWRRPAELDRLAGLIAASTIPLPPQEELLRRKLWSLPAAELLAEGSAPMVHFEVRAALERALAAALLPLPDPGLAEALRLRFAADRGAVQTAASTPQKGPAK